MKAKHDASVGGYSARHLGAALLSNGFCRRCPRSVRRIRAAACFIAVWVALWASVMSLCPASYAAKSVTLANGLQVIAEEMRVSPLVAVSVLYRVGSRSEVSGHTGASHFVEHMLFNGTQKYPADKATKEILKNGGIPIGETWWDYTHFGAVLPSDKIDLALDIEADRMANATVDSQAVKDERDIILEELAMRGEAPIVVLIEDLFATAFKVHPYHHWFPGGYFGDVLNMEPEYVQTFYKEHYNPANAVVAVVGNINEDEAIEKVRQYFEVIGGGARPPEALPEEPEQKGLRRVTVRGTATESRLMIFFKGPAYASRDFEVGSVLAVLLGSGRSSILRQKIVDKGIATDIALEIFPTIDPFGFLLMASVAKDGDIRACERATYGALEDFKAKPQSEDLITRTKTRTEGLTVLGRETVRARAFELGTSGARGNWEYADQFIENIRSVTPDEMMQVARTYLDWDRATIGWLIPEGAGPGNEELIGSGMSPGEGIGAADERLALPGPLAISQAEPQGSIALTFADAKFEELPNGVTIIMKQDHSLPIVAMSIYVQAGSAYEPEGKSGLARLTAKTVAMGSATHPYKLLYDWIEGLGSDISVETDMERAYLSTSVLASHGREACQMICDLLASPSFRADDFKRAKREVLSEISQIEEDATKVGINRFRDLYYAGHPFSRPVAGDADVVRKLSLKDVRAFYDNAWLPQKAVIAVVGDFSPDEMMQTLTGLLSGWKSKGKAVSELPELQTKPGYSQYIETLPEKKQAKIFWGMRAPGIKDAQFDPFQVMNFIFGGQAFGSRLFDRIREKESLAYVVSTNMDLTSQPGALYVYLGTRPKNVKSAINAVREEIGRITADGVTDEEMEATKGFLKALLPFQMQTYSQISDELLNLKFFGLPQDYYDTYGARIDKVTKQDVLEAARAYLTPDNSYLVIVGPIDQNLEALKPTFKRGGTR